MFTVGNIIYTMYKIHNISRKKRKKEKKRKKKRKREKKEKKKQQHQVRHFTVHVLEGRAGFFDLKNLRYFIIYII